MDEKKQADVPYHIYEGALVRSERYFKRAICALIAVIAISLFVVAVTVLINNYMWMKHIEKDYTPVIESTEEP